jgi:DNA invertase Pin-like site-specific DNA recombinase
MQKQSDKITALYYRSARKNTDTLNLDNQMQKLLCCAKARELSCFMLYADNGANGLALDRPAFNAMREDIGTGRISNIVVADVGRIGRGIMPVLQFDEWIGIAPHRIGVIDISNGGRAETELLGNHADIYRALAKGGERA